MSEKIVIKIGGDLLKENLNYVISDLLKIYAENNKIRKPKEAYEHDP